MPHQRILKPDFFSDADLLDLPPLYRLFYAGLWCWADRKGTLEDRPRQLKLRILPCDEMDPEAAISEFVARGKIIRFKVGDKSLLAIASWAKNQPVHASERSSGLQDVSQATEIVALPLINRLLTVSSGELPAPPSPVPVPVPSPIKSTVEQARPPGPASRVFEHWKRVMGHPKALLDPKRKRAVQARLDEGRTPEDLMLAVDGCARTPHNMGENDRHQRFDDLELICRNGPQVERFMRNATGPPATARREHLGATGTDDQFRREMADFKTDEEGYLIP